MNGRAWHRWFKKTRPSKDVIWDAKAELRWIKPVDRALKFAKKALREMKKADPNQDGCGLWYDVNDSFGYREMCSADGRRCHGEEDPGCPYRNLKLAIKGLGGEATPPHTP